MDQGGKLGRCALAGGFAALALASPAALAQRVGENAVASSGDAFGTTVGSESSGIYNENDTRGLSPIKAGNARIDGIYFDPVATLPGRLRASYGIRVGIAANDYPFPAPTGIVDNRLRSAGDKFVASLNLTKLQYSGHLEELDFQIPLVKDHLSIVLGLGQADTVGGDGSRIPSRAVTVKPVIRAGGAEVSPFYTFVGLYDVHQRPLFVTSGTLIPPLPPVSHYLGQDWAKGATAMTNTGVTVRAPLTTNWSMRGGLFFSQQIRKRNYTEVFSFSGPGNTATHRIISDPRQDNHSLSGEVQFAYRIAEKGKRMQRLILGYRFRQRQNEAGGSDFRSLGTIDITGFDPEPEPTFSYGPVNRGEVRQGAFLLGYQARYPGIGRFNLGLQRAHYRATFLTGATGATTATAENAWLYNASFAVDLADHLEFFAGTQKGLEDSGAAPENAANRNEQLPTTRSTQFEGGLRWKLGKSQLVASLFQITRPYFSFDATNRFVALGDARYRGAEVSLNGHFDRLTVLAGAVAMKPQVTGPGRAVGLAGERPAGTPSLYARADLQYRTDLPGNLTPTLTVLHTGRRAMGSAPLAALGGRQAMLPSLTTLDLGLRAQAKLGSMPVSLRAVMLNVFDTGGWKIVASNTLQPDERRRVMLTLTTDF